jgi:hypothetical protein
MATTTNYGWTTPDDTALVKDGAAAIRTLGSSVDTTTKALNPSTTLGDIEYRSSTANTNTRLGIGTTGQILTVAGGVPSWATPSGSAVTQIKFATKTDTFSSSSSSYTDITGASVSITPSSASSKILVMCTFSFSAPTSVTQTMFRAMRDSTAIFLGDSAGSRTQATAGSTYVADFNGQSALTVSFQFIDSPATTSATTYKLQGKSNGNAWYVGRSGSDGDGSNSPRLPLTIIASEVTAS